MTDLPPTAEQFRRDLLAWADDGNLRSFTWRDPDASVYEVFVAEFFLTQTPAEHVADIHPEFVATYPSLAALSEATSEELAAVIEPLGFQNMRADALTEIAATHDVLPVEREGLLALPRVGLYIADATLCFGTGERLPIVDRNVTRVYDRFFGDAWPSDDTGKRAFAAAMLPDEATAVRRYNFALLDFGASVCTKQDPACETCFAATYCRYYQDQTAD